MQVFVFLQTLLGFRLLHCLLELKFLINGELTIKKVIVIDVKFKYARDILLWFYRETQSIGCIFTSISISIYLYHISLSLSLSIWRGGFIIRNWLL